MADQNRASHHFVLYVAESASQAILAQAQRAYPNECFGALLGRDALVLRAEPVRNLSDQPDRFDADPHDLLRTERLASSLQMQVIGYYHSHPNGDPGPSERDLAGRIWPDLPPYYHIIVGVGGFARPRLAGYDMRTAPWAVMEVKTVHEDDILG